jgi:hypothetical protein
MRSQPRSSSTKVHRINVNFSENAYAALTVLADEQGKTQADVLRDALGLEKWIHDERKMGNRILIERDGVAREVIPR